MHPALRAPRIAAHCVSAAKAAPIGPDRICARCSCGGGGTTGWPRAPSSTAAAFFLQGRKGREGTRKTWQQLCMQYAACPGQKTWAACAQPGHCWHGLGSRLKARLLRPRALQQLWKGACAPNELCAKRLHRSWGSSFSPAPTRPRPCLHPGAGGSFVQRASLRNNQVRQWVGEERRRGCLFT